MKVFRSLLSTPCLLIWAAWLTFPFSVSAACGGLFTGPTGELTSPGYPGTYPVNQDCVYLIQRPEGEVIYLAFHELDLEQLGDCLWADYLQIRDGDSEISPVRESLCGSEPPAGLFRSFFSSVWIRFHSDSYSSLGSFAGFKITYTSGPVMKEQFFLLASQPKLMIMHGDGGGSMALPIPDVYFPVAVEFDPVQRRVFWADKAIGGIRSAYLNGSKLKTEFIHQDNDYCEDLALDPMARLLFVCQSLAGKVVMISLRTGHHRTMLSGLSNVYSFEVDHSEGLLFWAESMSSPSIYRVNYDGSGRRKLISHYLSIPYHLALDRPNKRLYWVNTELEKVEWSDYEGKGRSSQFATLTSSIVFSLTVTDNHIHVVSWQETGKGNTYRSVLGLMDKTGSNFRWAQTMTSLVWDILFHDSATWFSLSNGCAGDNGGCSDFCVPMGSQRQTQCLCPDSQVLSADHKKCHPHTVSYSENGRVNLYTFNDADEVTDDDDHFDKENLLPLSQSLGTATTAIGSQTHKSSQTEISPGQNRQSQPRPDVQEQTRDDAKSSQTVDGSRHDPWKKQATVTVAMSGPRPFVTDGSQEMHLTCLHAGRPEDTLWRDAGHCVQVMGHVCRLRPRVPEDDGKVIRCEAHLEDGSSGSSSFTLQLHYPPQFPPVITGYTSGQMLRVGDKLTMVCEVKGGKPLVSAVNFYCPGHLDTEPDQEERTQVRASLKFERLTSADDRVTCVCSADWKVPEMYSQRTYVTLRVERAARGEL